MTPNSRSYLNRWVQPDSIIPDPYNPQDYDRYSYVHSNPINFNDPTGHDADCASTDTECKKLIQTCKKNETTVLDKVNEGDLTALINLGLPTHTGFRAQLEISIPVTHIFDISITIGDNVVWNFRQGKIDANLDFSVEPGIGAGGGASLTAGPILGWFSSDVKEITTGYSTVGGVSAAAVIAGTMSASVPQTSANPLDGHLIDPYFGVPPVTYYLGVGGGGIYGGGNAGVSTTIFH